MKNSQRNRLTRLEKASGIDHPPLCLSIVYTKPNGHSGGADCESSHADVNGQKWLRNQDESEADFRDRVKSQAPRRRGGLTVIVFIPRETELDEDAAQ